jgi:hypothetical protein
MSTIKLLITSLSSCWFSFNGLRKMLGTTVKIKRGNVCLSLYGGGFVQSLLQRKSKKYYMLWVWVCSLRYPACSARALNYINCGLYGCIIFFSHYLIPGTLFEKKGIERKVCVLIFSTNLPETFIILRRFERDITINIHRASCEVPVVIVRFQYYFNFISRLFFCS